MSDGGIVVLLIIVAIGLFSWYVIAYNRAADRRAWRSFMAEQREIERQQELRNRPRW